MKNLPPTSTDACSSHKPTHEAQYVYAHMKHGHDIALTQTLSLKACMIMIIVFALVHLKKNKPLRIILLSFSLEKKSANKKKEILKPPLNPIFILNLVSKMKNAPGFSVYSSV